MSQKRMDNLVCGILKGKTYKSESALKSDVVKALANEYGVDQSYFVLDVFDIKDAISLSSEGGERQQNRSNHQAAEGGISAAPLTRR